MAKYTDSRQTLLDGPYIGLTIGQVYNNGDHVYLLELIDSGEWNCANDIRSTIADRVYENYRNLGILADSELDYVDNYD